MNIDERAVLARFGTKPGRTSGQPVPMQHGLCDMSAMLVGTYKLASVHSCPAAPTVSSLANSDTALLTARTVI